MKKIILTVILYFVTLCIKAQVTFVQNSVSGLTCTGKSISVLATGTGTILYKLNNSLYSSNNTFTINTNGIYTITASNGVDTAAVIDTITGVNILTITTNAITTACTPGAGKGYVIANSGTPPYTYSWNTTPAQTTDTIYNGQDSVYFVTVTDAIGCVKQSYLSLQKGYLQAGSDKYTLCKGDTANLFSLYNNSTLGNTLPIGYPISSATSPNDEDILAFSIGSISTNWFCGSSPNSIAPSSVPINGLPASTPGQYSNYTNIPAPTFMPGETVPFQLTLGYCGATAWTNTASIYVDFNRNAVFDLPAEQVFVKPSGPVTASGQTFTDSFTIPITANLGLTLLRIVYVEGASSPTGQYTWGETEDYAIRIGESHPINAIWYPSYSLDTNYGKNVMAFPTSTTTYTLVSDDPITCIDSNFITITVADSLHYSTVHSIHTNTSCPNSQNGQISVTETPITSTLTYNWSNATHNPINKNLYAGAYSVNVYDTLGGCIFLQDSVIALNSACGDINGSVYNDYNYNCVLQANELGIPNTMLTINPGGMITFTDNLGYYQMNGLSNNAYTINKSNNVFGIGNKCGTSFSGNISNSTLHHYFLDSTYYNDYVITCQGNCFNPALPVNNVFLRYFQTTNQIGAGTIYAVLDSINTFASSSIPPSYTNGDTLFWNVTNFSTTANTISILFNINPATSLGTIFPIHFGIINTNFPDPYTWNNNSNKNIYICTSYDPNYKEVTPQGLTSAGNIAKDTNNLQYTIHFQNTGTSTAANVIVVDTISPLLDITKFAVQASSHPYSLELIDNHIFKFKFLGIMLPDSGANYNASQGFISYSIPQKTTTAIGDQITNSASIYFDYNAPIVTNTTLNTIFDVINWDSIAIANNTICDTSAMGNGSIAFTLSGNHFPYIYSISPSDDSVTIVGNTIQHLQAGTYTVIAKDAENFTVSTVVKIETNNGFQIDSVTASPHVCFNQTNGSIQVNTNTLDTSTLYWLNTNASQQSNLFSNLIGGIYTATALQTNGCWDTMSVKINATPTFQITSISKIDSKCDKNNGYMYIYTSANTTNPKTYFANGISQTSNYFNNLADSTYVVTVTDGFGCTISSNVIIANIAGPQINSIAITSAICGNANGKMIVNASGGTGTKIYYKNNISNGYNNTFNNLIAGNYLIKITDANNCPDSISVSVADSATIWLDSIKTTNATCTNSNGGIQIFASSLSPNLQYTIFSNTNATGLFSNLSNGIYTISVTNSTNCTLTQSTSIIDFPSPTIDSILTNPNICNQGNGAISVFAIGGSGAINYSANSISNATGLFSGLIDSTYLVIISDTNNCKDSAVVTVANLAGATIDSIVTTPNICALNNGTATVYASGGLAPINYSINSITSTANIFIGLSNSTYTIQIADANNCTASNTISIANAPKPNFSLLATPILCTGATGIITATIISSSTQLLTYSIDNGATFQSSNIFPNLQIGNYAIIVKDSNNCTAIDSISLNTDSVLAIANTTVTQANGGVWGSASITAQGGVIPYQFLWQPGNSVTGNISNLQAGTYTCTITDANNCSVSTNIVIEIPLKIENILVQNSIHLYPNPANSNLHIDCDFEIENVKFVNTLGQTVLIVNAEKAKNILIDVNTLANGTYQIVFANGLTKKIIIKR